MVSRSRRFRNRGGAADTSVCPSLKTQDECVVCKWNVKTSKCGKATVRKGAKKAQSPSPSSASAASSPKAKPKPKPKRAPATKPGCPALDKSSCDSNDDCSWNAKTSKCRKRTVTVKKGPAGKKVSPVKASAATAATAVVAAAAASPVKSNNPVEIPENKKFREENLEGADFSGMDLGKVTFFACNLKNANFQNADLTDAIFSTCELDGANFSGATIIDAEFTYCEVGVPRAYNLGIQVKPLICVNSTIKNTRFENFRFGNSNYSGTTFEFCDFGDCQSENANFSGCKFTPNPIVRKHVSSVTVIRECRFQLSNFTNADFRGCEFDSNRHDNFDGCATDEDCGNHFNGCILTGAKFPEKVNMCSFSDAVLTGSDISDPKKDIQGCYFDATTEAEDVEELKRRAIPPEDEDDDWMSPPVKQKSPSPRVKTPSPVKKMPSPVKKAVSPPSPAPAGTKCVRQTQKKYLERPSPPYSAADCCGMALQGNDGKMYVSVANAKGICAWKIQK
jgi:uncharacterized protein YjbI with pentapeptide repeats